MKKRILSLALALVMALSLFPVASLAAEEYGDVAGHWAESSIERWSGYNIVEGDGGNFYPNRSLTRGEMAKIIANTLGLTEEGEENPFDDVSADAWYAPYVLRCYVAGIMKGSAGHANPTDIITRQETMVILGRALGMEPVENADLSAFDDGEKVADWAKSYVAAMTQANIVNGVSEGVLAPTDSIDRASILAILDRSIAVYANEDGAEVDAANVQGLILIVAKNVTITNAPEGTKVLASVGAEGATVNGKSISTGEAVTAEKEEVKQTVSGGGSSGGGGGGGGNRPSTPTYSDLTIDEAKTVSEGTYKNVTISANVGDGTVTLANVTIQQDLTIRGGGANTVHLDTVTIGGKVILDKTLTESSTEQPRLNLTKTEVKQVEVKQAAILEGDSDSAIQSVTASANTTIQGSNTAVTTVEIPASESESAVELTVNGGSVSTVSAKGEATVKGTGKVENVKAEAAVSVDSTTVDKVEVPATAPKNVSVAVSGSGSVEVAVDSDKGAAITTSDGANVEISTSQETNPDVTVDGSAVSHIHKWEKTGETAANCTQDGERTFTCTAEGCDTDDQTEGAQPATKTEIIKALGHDPAAEWKSDGNNHWHVCQREGCGAKVDEVKHTWTGKWTYVDADNHKDTCTICKYDKVLEHHVVTDDAVDATCATAGKTEGSRCDQCNQVLKAQTDVKALGHDFKNGEVKYDAEGHWHVCGNKGCDETDSKTAHSYPANAKCDEKTACSAGCGYEKPAGEHAWGAWSKQDGTYHVHSCSLCGTTATEAHKWDNGTITTEPEGETDGVKTYACTVEGCNATKTEAVPARTSWVEYNTYNSHIIFHGTDTTRCYYVAWVSGTEKYVQRGYANSIDVDFNYYTNLMAVTESQKMSCKFTGGDNYGEATSSSAPVIATFEFDFVLAEENSALNLTVQEDGSYKISGGKEGYDGYYYRVKMPDGTYMLTSGSCTPSDKIYIAPYEGCTVEISQFKIEFDGEPFKTTSYQKYYEGIKSYTLTKPVSVTITSDNLPTAPSETRTVTTADELEAELCKGGTVKLGADITDDEYYVSISRGAPAILDLNGHTLTMPYLYIAYGKELTINGTTEGSAVEIKNFSSTSGTKLTLNGGTYNGCRIQSNWAREFKMENVKCTGLSGVNALWIHDVQKVVLKDSSFKQPDGSIGLYIWDSKDVTLDGLTVTTDDIRIINCTKATIKNSTFKYSTTTDRSWLRFEAGTGIVLENVTPAEGNNLHVALSEDSTATIKSGEYYSVDAKSDERVTIEGGTFHFNPSKYLAEGYTATKDEEARTWSVSKTGE